MKFLKKNPLLKTMIDQGYISVQNHPIHKELFLLNYTAKAQYERIWNKETLSCRGLVLHESGKPVAIPFRKFFNYNEHIDVNLKNKIPSINIDADFTAYEKLDGSLGICFFYAGKWHICTKGSFVSEQSQEAEKMLYSLYESELEKLDPKVTYLFEIIYPENRIVVLYEEKKELVLLGAVDVFSQKEIDLQDLKHLNFRQPKTFQTEKIEDLPSEVSNFEGYVIKYSSGERVKVKLDEYVNLHALVTNFNKKTAWQALKENKDLEEFLTNIPDELYEELRRIINEVRQEYDEIEKRHLDAYHRLQLDSLSSEKECAQVIMKAHHNEDLDSGLLFALARKKEDRFKKKIFKMIKPKTKKIEE